ncbi:MAG: hypothetical protein ABIN23_08065 [candidate division WOR-3 bacterium]
MLKVSSLTFASLTGFAIFPESSKLLFISRSVKLKLIPESSASFKDKNLVIYNSRGDLTPYTNPEQFKKCAISNYFIWEWKKYNYSESKLNDYAKKILDMANKGWPGGTRWLFNENF